ncbi:MAG: glycosyltransferase [Acidimicrobiia bacterium]
MPVLAAGDAIGNHVLRIRRILREAGYDSEVFAGEIHHAVRREARSHLDYRPPPAATPTWFLYHLSTGHSMAAWLAERPEPLGVDYHNITPAEYFDRWYPPAAEVARAARAEMRKLASRSRFALADSSYNAAELDAEGYRQTSVAPILIDFSEYDAPPDAATLGRLRRRAEGGGAHWLFVGRLSANKCQHDVIGAFAVYRRLYDPRARLSIVGGRTALLYSRALQLLAADLGVADAVDFAEALSFDRLLAYFSTADVFVSLSEHEGFCVPVLEAMHFSVPVVAYSSTAVPETVADAALLLDDKDPLVVATAVHRVLTDGPFRERLVAAGTARVAHFSFQSNRARFLAALETGLARG